MNMRTNTLKFTAMKSLPVIIQDEVAECGLACIAMVSNYLGHEIDMFSLRLLAKTSIRGANLGDLIQICTELQLTTRAIRVDLEQLAKVRTPAILHWNMNHFVVLKEVKQDQVIIHDPAVGLRKCKWQEVSEAFTGVVLELDRADNFESIRLKNKLSLYDLFKNINGITKSLGLLLMLSIIIEFFALINPLFIQYVTDSVLSVGDNNNLYVLAAGFMFLVIAGVFTEYIRSHVIIFITNNLSEQFAANVVRHILHLPLDYFAKRHKGDIQARFQSIEQIQRKISTDFITTLLDGFMIAVTVLVMLIYNVTLTLVVCFTLLIYVAVRYVSYQSLKKQTEASLSSHAKSSSVFLETLAGMLPIKSYGKEDVRFNLWRNSYVTALNADIGIAKANVMYSTLNQLLFGLDYIAVICLGASLTIANHFSVGMLMAFLAYRNQLVNKSTSFIQKLFDYKLISVHLARLGDILFQSPEKITLNHCLSNDIKGELKLVNLSYCYETSANKIFSKLNLHISAGEKVVITGPSGCGKTTLLKVIMGLLQQNSGDVYLDGITVQQFGLRNYRNLTASVMQDDVLMSGSILQNICFFAESIDLQRAYNCAELAQVHSDIVAMPMGYESLVGDLGSSLSGGQKQRILLARALYKQPKILFLDEATSHLDLENEIKINQALKALAITQVVIAHREETIRMADRVIDLQIEGSK